MLLVGRSAGHLLRPSARIATLHRAVLRAPTTRAAACSTQVMTAPVVAATVGRCCVAAGRRARLAHTAARSRDDASASATPCGPSFSRRALGVLLGLGTTVVATLTAVRFYFGFDTSNESFFIGWMSRIAGLATVCIGTGTAVAVAPGMSHLSAMGGMAVVVVGTLLGGFGMICSLAAHEESSGTSLSVPGFISSLRESPEEAEAHKDLGGMRKLATVEENGQYVEPKRQK